MVKNDEDADAKATILEKPVEISDAKSNKNLENEAAKKAFPKKKKAVAVNINSPIKNQLLQMQQRFTGFNQSLAQDRDRKINERKAMFLEIQEGVSHITSEVKKITESRVLKMKTIQLTNMEKIENWEAHATAGVDVKLEKIIIMLKTVQQRINIIRTDHEKLMEKSQNQIDEFTKQDLHLLRNFDTVFQENIGEISAKGDGVVSTLKEKDRVYHGQFKVELAQWNENILTLKNKLTKKCTERQNMTEQFRNGSEDILANIVKRIKIEDTTRQKQKHEFIQNIEHFTKRLNKSIKRM